MLKSEAEQFLVSWQHAILSPAPAPAEPDVKAGTLLTLEGLAKLYLDGHVNIPTRRTRAASEMARQVRVLLDADVNLLDGRKVRLGSVPASETTKPVLEAFRRTRRDSFETLRQSVGQASGIRETVAADANAGGANCAAIEVPKSLRLQAARAAISTKGSEVGTNRLLTRLKHMLRWAVDEELLDTLPRGVQAVKLNAEAESPRQRRLEGNEETRLLAAAASHLRAIIECALETGMRKGEILGLQWQHVNLDRGLILLPGSVTKTRKARAVAVSARLKAILQIRQHGPDGKALPLTAYVFGNEVGDRVQSVKTAWRLACRRAKVTGLHFHDLRREAGSRLLEAGLTVVDARDFLGHRDVSQTNTYLATTVARQQEMMAKLEEARRARRASTIEPAGSPAASDEDGSQPAEVLN